QRRMRMAPRKPSHLMRSGWRIFMATALLVFPRLVPARRRVVPSLGGQTLGVFAHVVERFFHALTIFLQLRPAGALRNVDRLERHDYRLAERPRQGELIPRVEPPGPIVADA